MTAMTPPVSSVEETDALPRLAEPGLSGRSWALRRYDEERDR
jgi:hypothetical protein